MKIKTFINSFTFNDINKEVQDDVINKFCESVEVLEINDEIKLYFKFKNEDSRRSEYTLLGFGNIFTRFYSQMIKEIPNF